MKVKREKCFSLLSEVEYLGHMISSAGLRPSKAKAAAITGAPAPTNETELKLFPGLVNYYAKFLPNLATVLAPSVPPVTERCEVEMEVRAGGSL